MIGWRKVTADRPDGFSCPESQIPQQRIHLAAGLEGLRVGIVEYRERESLPARPKVIRHSNASLLYRGQKPRINARIAGFRALVHSPHSSL